MLVSPQRVSMFAIWSESIQPLRLCLCITRSSAIAGRPARRSVLVETLFYCCTNNANKSPASVRSTFSDCHVLFRYLHSCCTRIVQLSHSEHGMPWVSSADFRTSVQPYYRPCWCQLNCNCDHQISTSIRVKCWWRRVFFHQRIVLDRDHRGGWTQIFGGKASVTETFGPVVKRNITYSTCILRPR